MSESYAIYLADKKHLWDDFRNSTPLTDGLPSKQDARCALVDFAERTSPKTKFTIARVMRTGHMLAGGPISAETILNQTKELANAC
jgi:hypothetical protein